MRNREARGCRRATTARTRRAALCDYLHIYQTADILKTGALENIQLSHDQMENRFKAYDKRELQDWGHHKSRSYTHKVSHIEALMAVLEWAWEREEIFSGVSRLGWVQKDIIERRPQMQSILATPIAERYYQR